MDLGVEAHLNTAFKVKSSNPEIPLSHFFLKHFYLFIREFDLVETKEMAPLQHLIDKINGQIQAKDDTNNKVPRKASVLIFFLFFRNFRKMKTTMMTMKKNKCITLY